jgi:preprotein translocase subunit Sec63
MIFRWLVLAVGIWLLWRFTRRALAPPAQGNPSGRDPYQVLGLTAGASADEITRAYREQIKLYHPDRVADLGEDLQRLAHDKTVEIQRAYQELTKPR